MIIVVICWSQLTAIWYYRTVHDKNVPVLRFALHDWTYWRLNDSLSVGNRAGKTISIVRYSRRAWRREILAAIAIVSTRVVAYRLGDAAAGWLYKLIIIICCVRHMREIRGWLMRFSRDRFCRVRARPARVTHDSWARRRNRSPAVIRHPHF